MLTSSVFTGLSWSPVTDVRALFAFPFMQHALAAGTIVAVMAGVIGWFMVLRRQTFAGHTLSVTAFTGASAATGSIGALALALGFLFVSLYHGVLTGLDSLLFGTFLGITSSQVLVLLVVAAAALVVVAVAARPLLFASVDPDVARAGGVPVRLLGLGFLLVLGLSVAETS